MPLSVDYFTPNSACFNFKKHYHEWLDTLILATIRYNTTCFAILRVSSSGFKFPSSQGRKFKICLQFVTFSHFQLNIGNLVCANYHPLTNKHNKPRDFTNREQTLDQQQASIIWNKTTLNFFRASWLFGSLHPNYLDHYKPRMQQEKGLSKIALTSLKRTHQAQLSPLSTLRIVKDKRETVGGLTHLQEETFF